MAALFKAWEDSWVEGESGSKYTQKLPQGRRIDLMVDLGFDDSIDDKGRQRRKHCAYWFPFISDEGLRTFNNHQNIWILLFSRATNSPDRFILADSQHEYLRALVVKIRDKGSGFAPYYGMRFFLKSEEMAQGEMKYGEIIPFSKDCFADGRALPCDFGIEALSLQSRIYSFLVRFAKTILNIQDKDIDALKPQDPPPTLGASYRSVEDPLFYRTGGQVEDIQEIIDNIEPTRSLAATHMRLLREDPQYFHDRFNELVDHQPEYLGKVSMVRGKRVVTKPKARDLDMNKIKLVASKSIQCWEHLRLCPWILIHVHLADLSAIRERFDLHGLS